MRHAIYDLILARSHRLRHTTPAKPIYFRLEQLEERLVLDDRFWTGAMNAGVIRATGWAVSFLA